jgi:hypothetical protein
MVLFEYGQIEIGYLKKRDRKLGSAIDLPDDEIIKKLSSLHGLGV